MALVVTVEVNETTATAVVTNNGSPVNAEVQWFEDTPWRDAPLGLATMVYWDDAAHALTGVRYDPRDELQVTGRYWVNGAWVYSETVTANLPVPAPPNVSGGPESVESMEDFLAGIGILMCGAGCRYTLPQDAIDASCRLVDGDYLPPEIARTIVFLGETFSGNVVLHKNLRLFGLPGAAFEDDLEVSDVETGDAPVIVGIEIAGTVTGTVERRAATQDVVTLVDREDDAAGAAGRLSVYAKDGELFVGVGTASPASLGAMMDARSDARNLAAHVVKVGPGMVHTTIQSGIDAMAVDMGSVPTAGVISVTGAMPADITGLKFQYRTLSALKVWSDYVEVSWENNVGSYDLDEPATTIAALAGWMELEISGTAGTVVGSSMTWGLDASGLLAIQFDWKGLAIISEVPTLVAIYADAAVKSAVQCLADTTENITLYGPNIDLMAPAGPITVTGSCVAAGGYIDPKIRFTLGITGAYTNRMIEVGADTSFTEASAAQATAVAAGAGVATPYVLKLRPGATLDNVVPDTVGIILDHYVPQVPISPIRVPYDPEKIWVAYQSDDGSDEWLDIQAGGSAIGAKSPARYVAELGIPVSHGIIPSYMSNAAYLSLAELRLLFDQAGHEIMAQSYSHATVALATAWKEIVGARDYLETLSGAVANPASLEGTCWHNWYAADLAQTRWLGLMIRGFSNPGSWNSDVATNSEYWAFRKGYLWDLISRAYQYAVLYSGPHSPMGVSGPRISGWTSYLGVMPIAAGKLDTTKIPPGSRIRLIGDYPSSESGGLAGWKAAIDALAASVAAGEIVMVTNSVLVHGVGENRTNWGGLQLFSTMANANIAVGNENSHYWWTATNGHAAIGTGKLVLNINTSITNNPRAAGSKFVEHQFAFTPGEVHRLVIPAKASAASGVTLYPFICLRVTDATDSPLRWYLPGIPLTDTEVTYTRLFGIPLQLRRGGIGFTAVSAAGTETVTLGDIKCAVT
jgi:hypothetical protein